MRHERTVSAGVVVFHRSGEGCTVLLLLSRLTKRPLWEFPKGGIDPGETRLQAAVRELREEAGLGDADIRVIPGFERTEHYRFTVGTGAAKTLVHKEVTYFAATALHQDVERSTVETLDHAWLSVGEARRRLKYAARRRILEEAAEAAGCTAPAAATSAVSRK